MYILSQDGTAIVKLSGVVLQLNEWTTNETGFFGKYAVQHKEFALMCVSESGLELEPADSRSAVSPGMIEVGSFGSLERAKQEIESIAKAIDEQSRIYRIKKR